MYSSAFPTSILLPDSDLMFRLYTYTPSPCFTSVCFIPFFCFNASCQFTPLLSLCYLISGLTPFGWFICIRLIIFFPMKIFLIKAFYIYVHFFFSETK